MGPAASAPPQLYREDHQGDPQRPRQRTASSRSRVSASSLESEEGRRGIMRRRRGNEEPVASSFESETQSQGRRRRAKSGEERKPAVIMPLVFTKKRSSTSGASDSVPRSPPGRHVERQSSVEQDVDS